MAGLRLRVIGCVVGGSMLISSTVAAAAGSSHAAQQINPWATLTVLTGGAPAAAVCGAAVAAAAAQPATGCVLPVMDAPPVAPVAEAPPPVAPVVPAATAYGISPLLLGLVAIAAAAGFYFAVKDDDRNRQPNSVG
jgi:hypothetical protein